ncbi:hypothetical protein HDV01_001720 [Terramyces sp. JEL0728]|nr:hypothetical protein HDV01_001720 [Terramyces sp. JEL0728]
MFPPESIGNLNRISEILINQDPAVISKEQILGALHLQKQKTKKLLLHNDERVLYALVLYQALLYLDNGGIKGARNCYSYFGHFSINSWPEHYPALAGIEKHAKNLYIGYTNVMPDQKYQLPNDSSFNDLLVLQDAISGEPSAQVKLAIKFKNMKPPNEVAADFWLMKAARTGFIPQPDEIEVLESTFGKSKRQSIQSIASINSNSSKNDKRMSVLSLGSMLPEIMEKLAGQDVEENMSKRLSALDVNLDLSNLVKLDQEKPMHESLGSESPNHTGIDPPLKLHDGFEPAVKLQKSEAPVKVQSGIEAQDKEIILQQDRPSHSSLNTMVSQPERKPQMQNKLDNVEIIEPQEPKGGFCFCF